MSKSTSRSSDAQIVVVDALVDLGEVLFLVGHHPTVAARDKPQPHVLPPAERGIVNELVHRRNAARHVPVVHVRVAMPVHIAGARKNDAELHVRKP